MQVPSNYNAGSIAGTPHAAKRGGSLEAATRNLAAGQSVTTNPAGKTNETDAIDAGDQAGDRRGDGRQQYDTFERLDGGQVVDVTNKPSRQTGVASRTIDYQA